MFDPAAALQDPSSPIRLTLDSFGPDSEALLRLVCAEVDDEMLKEIASADHGCDYREPLEQLRRIRESPETFGVCEWAPHDELSLTRWSDPKPDDFRRHRIRLFACAVLLRIRGDERDLDAVGVDIPEDCARLVESAMALGEGHLDAALRFFVWLAKTPRDYYDHEDGVCLSLATLVATVRLRKDGEAVEYLLDWLLSEFELEDNEQLFFGQHTEAADAPHEKGTNRVVAVGNQGKAVWFKLIDGALLHPPDVYEQSLRRRLSTVGARLLGKA